MFGKRKVINFDESTIAATTSRVFSWHDKSASRGRNRRSISGLSLMLAVSEDGLMFYNFI
jgi:hypothetical protein